jgi:hypothetical protein
MEVRILEPVIPPLKIAPGKLPGIEEPADRAVLGPLRATFCGEKEERGPESLTARALVRRNVLHHMTLVRKPDCTAMPKDDVGTEWYLKWRDALFRANSREMP